MKFHIVDNQDVYVAIPKFTIIELEIHHHALCVLSPGSRCVGSNGLSKR